MQTTSDAILDHCTCNIVPLALANKAQEDLFHAVLYTGSEWQLNPNNYDNYIFILIGDHRSMQSAKQS